MSDILSGKTGKIWRGGNATSAKVATTSEVLQSFLVSFEDHQWTHCKIQGEY